MTAADLLVLAPWLIFGAGLAAICYRLLAPALLTGAAAMAGDGYPGAGGSWVRHPRLPAIDPLVTGISRGCAEISTRPPSPGHRRCASAAYPGGKA